MTQSRWAPVLPSLGGRLAPRITFEGEIPLGYDSKLESYYLWRRGCVSMFSHNVDGRVLRASLGKDLTNHYLSSGRNPRLEDLAGYHLYKVLMKSLGRIRMSKHFTGKLHSLCCAGKADMATIKRWWQTTDGVVLPLILSVEDPDRCYPDIDRLTKFSLENCANNYAHFTSRMKSLKRLLRKDYALMTSESKALTDVSTYRDVMLRHKPHGDDPHEQVRYLLCWTQTRASGLADSVMVRRSLDKCEATLSTPRRPRRIPGPEFRSLANRDLPAGEPELPRGILSEVCWRVSNMVRGETAHLTAGPNACLESTRQTGGQTGYVKCLARRPCLHTVYDYRTLEPTSQIARPVRSQHDLLSWAIQETLEHPAYVRCVRLHAVPEPSKARTITVSTLPYLILIGVVAKLFQPAIASDITRGGLRASRNLWNFLFNDLDPELGLWASIRDEHPRGQEILGLSSDLSEATDYGDLGVARQIFSGLLEKCSGIPGFPLGLCSLAKTLFIGKRFCFRYHDRKGYRYFVKRNGWLMGDRITKVILTLAHEIVVASSGLHCARICGDDVIAFSRDRVKLEKYFEEVRRLGFKVSEEDSYISSRLAFYCEEGCVPPQRYRELPTVCVRRKDQSMYIDYPRIRLLIPTHVETRAYSYTDVGRFSLLGKESRWVRQNGLTRVQPIFHRAGLLQHLLVAQPADTICPYIPIELGGDGAYPHSWHFLKEVVLSRARDFREVQFRMLQLLKSKWGFRFVRSSNLNDVIHKYHVLVPKIQELKGLLNPEAIIEGNELLLGSIKIDGVEPPEASFFRIWRAWYWSSILQHGREPPKLDMSVERHMPHAHDEVNMTDVDYARFHLNWTETGFTFRDTPDYLVWTKYAHVHDMMNMGWWFGFPNIRGSGRPTLAEVGGRKLLNEENIENFLLHMQRGRPLSPIVNQTIHKYVESDSYILAMCERRWKDSTPPTTLLLVSGDKRLAASVARMQRTRYYHREPDSPGSRIPWVILIPPTSYLFGMMSSYEEEILRSVGGELETIVDPGAVMYAAYLSSGLGEWYDQPRIYLTYLWERPELGVMEAEMDEASAQRSELWSLTTQLPDQVRKRYVPWLAPRTIDPITGLPPRREG